MNNELKDIHQKLFLGKKEDLDLLKRKELSFLNPVTIDLFEKDKKDLSYWHPIFIVFIIIGINFLFNIFHQGISIVLVCLSLVYIKFVVSFFENKREIERLELIKKELKGTEYELSGEELIFFNQKIEELRLFKLSEDKK